MGNQKGPNFDRWVAKALSRWYYDCEDALKKTQGSKSLKGYADQIGDLGIAKAVSKPWVFGVENKHRDRSSGPKRKGLQYPAWSIDEFLINGTESELYAYWFQCYEAANAGSKLPLLVCKRNYQVPIVVVQRSDFVEANKHSPMWKPGVVLSWKKEDMALFKFSDLTASNPDAWIRRWEEIYAKRA
jgi:hypothetical protein